MNNIVVNKINSYPEHIANLLNKIRSIIFEIAVLENLSEVEETLKWGEPSYFVEGASSVRFDWKSKTPENYYIYFNCNTKLVETFRILYANKLKFQGNRAIILDINEDIPEDAIRHCITLSLKYKSIKDLPLLGE